MSLEIQFNREKALQLDWLSFSRVWDELFNQEAEIVSVVIDDILTLSYENHGARFNRGIIEGAVIAMQYTRRHGPIIAAKLAEAGIAHDIF